METPSKLKNYFFGTCVGFFLGFILLHPFSMLFQGVVSPSFHLRISIFAEVFNPAHLTMAAYFGFLGMIMGGLIVFFLTALSREKKRIKMLEGLLPICSYCKKIRDDSNKSDGKGGWVQMEKYISQRSKADFSHGICPNCYETHIEAELEKRYGKDQ